MRKKFQIGGIVQGVGFRPTVYRIAKELGLRGYVLNSGEGVVIEVEGEDASLFLQKLIDSLPPLARIDEVNEENLQDAGYEDFIIKDSLNSSKTAFVSPDISVCEECLKELRDKNNRRYLYPFINCTNCGPRYTIIKDIPYDRKNTSMNKFDMCEQCKKEYTDPLNRRYHAEPISCYECGPKLKIVNYDDSRMSEYEKIKFIAEKIKEGKIVALKGLGGFHLICDATNTASVKTLRFRKKRGSKPFALMFKDIDTVEKYCFINEDEKAYILSKERPIVIVKKRLELESVADGIDRYGVFLPYTPLHYLLFDFLDIPIVATSANISNEPIIRSYEEFSRKLNGVVDYVLDYDREIINACDDSVVSIVDSKPITMRCARGYAPFTISKQLKPSLLAVGANQKNTISLAFKNKIILSPHIGDLGTIESVEYFERSIKTFRRLYEFEEDYIICDKHPRYESTKWAMSQNKKVFTIQHHFAHALAVMGEYDLNGDFLAFIFDGTGYGDDGSIWGGEVFVVNRHEYRRIAYFKPFKLLGAEKGIKNPANTAVSLIDERLSEDFANAKLARSLKNAPFPYTSSVGRIFDMYAYLGGLIEKNEWEGLSGLRIERYYNENIKEKIELQYDKEIEFVELLNFAAKHRGEFELISSVFINSLVDLILRMSKEYELPVIVGGGVFQNKTLLSQVSKHIKHLYFNTKIPLNDGGVSFGQVCWGIWNI